MSHDAASPVPQKPTMGEQEAASAAAPAPTGTTSPKPDKVDPWEAMFARAAGLDVPAPKATAAASPPPQEEVEIVKELRTKELGELNAWALTPVGGDGYLKATEQIKALWSSADADRAPLVKVGKILPSKTARQLFRALGSSDAWELATAATDLDDAAENAGSTQHQYRVGDGGSKAGKALGSVIQLIENMVPEAKVSFQAAKYTKGHHIEPHDDTAHKVIEGRIYRRAVAIIFYLSKDWDASLGGSFIDHATGTEHVPRFNTLVAFRVPRLHQVSPLTTNRARVSVFGWLYEPLSDEETARVARFEPAFASFKRKSAGRQRNKRKRAKHRKAT